MRGKITERERRSNTNYKMFISRSLLKNIGTDEFVAKDLKTKERFSDKQKEEETQQDHSDELGNVHVHEFDIVFNAETLK